MAREASVYIAGPEVFLPDAVEIGARKRALCRAYGFEGLFPLDNAIAGAGEARLDHAIFRANVAMIRRCTLGICNLTPFRGPSADAGTVFELGLLAGLGKPVFGYANDPDDYLARVRRAGAVRREGRAWHDDEGMVVEDFGNADNLMIDACLDVQGRPLVRVSCPRDDRYRDLRGFEACLVEARREIDAETAPGDGAT